MRTLYSLIIIVSLFGTLGVNFWNYYLRQPKNWHAKAVLLIGVVLAMGIPAQYCVNRELSAEWKLSGAQKARLTQLLCQRPASERYKVRILVLPSDQNSRSFGDDLQNVFYDCHWDAEYVNDFSLAVDLVGVSVQVQNGTRSAAGAPVRARDLVVVLKAAGITDELRPAGTATQWDSAAISVGARPR
jgi:hypothetical protein